MDTRDIPRINLELGENLFVVSTSAGGQCEMIHPDIDAIFTVNMQQLGFQVKLGDMIRLRADIGACP
jgi:hypothetical protein